jgi:hypothetical protein
MEHSSTHPFERLVASHARALSAQWDRAQQHGATPNLAELPENVLRTCIHALQPRSLEEGMACQALGWAWADGAGVAEWDDQFLEALAAKERLASFLQMLRHLRAPVH